MKNENVILKGTSQTNRAALIVLIVGIVLALTSFIIADYCFSNVDVYYYSYTLGEGYWCPYHLLYDDNFISFFSEEFFSSCIYGYMLIAGIISTVVGLVLKVSTEKCEIVVTDKRVYGKISRGKDVEIPLNQIISIRSCSFNGVSIITISGKRKFYLIENYEEVLKAIAYLLAKPHATGQSTVLASFAATAGTTESEVVIELKKFKELLDSGVLTEEEFQAKKKQILGL